MSGFPVRPSRSAYGPEPVNRQPVDDPERQLGADIGALMFWQLAGIGLVGGRALAIVSSAGAITAHAESWDPKRDLAAPGIAHPGAGVYKITYPATAHDENGTQVAIALVGAHITCGGAAALHATWEIDANGHEITFNVWNAAGVAANGAFLATVF